jgi:hypothetical protein
MSITGPGSINAANLAAQTNIFNQLNKLSLQLGTGEVSQTYAGLGPQAGVALSLSSQLARSVVTAPPPRPSARR